MKKYVSLGLWIVSFEVVSMAIGFATQGGVDGWYQALQKPPLVPPNVIFPIMWTALYALIAAAGWNIWWMPAGADRAKLQKLFIIYMAMNWLWSFIFFSAHMMLAGFLWILVMNVLTLVLIMEAWRPARLSAALLIPLLAWTSFAAYLNGGYWYLN
jgi:benzodiazapine receptor